MLVTKVQVKWIPKKLENRPEWNFHAYKTVLPLIRVAQMLAETVRTRVVTRSEDAYGDKFKKYVTARTEHHVYWTQPWMPGGLLGGSGVNLLSAVKVITDTGRVGYHHSRAYHKTVKGKEHRNFFLTGGMWNSLRVRPMTPYHVRIAFYGKSKDHGARSREMPNSHKAYYSVLRERTGLLWVSDREQSEVYKFIRGIYDVKLSALIREDEANFKIRKVALRLDRVTRAKRRRFERALAKANAA